MLDSLLYVTDCIATCFLLYWFFAVSVQWPYWNWLSLKAAENLSLSFIVEESELIPELGKSKSVRLGFVISFLVLNAIAVFKDKKSLLALVITSFISDHLIEMMSFYTVSEMKIW